MPRNVSTAFVEAVNATQTDEAFLILMKLSHPDLGADDPLRLTSDAVETTSGGITYSPFPFEVALPKETDDLSGALAHLKTDAVDRRIIDAVRRIQGIPNFDMDVVLSSDPDSVELTWPTFKLSNARYTKTKVEGDLVLELLEQEPFPGESVNPATFPGVF